MYQFGTLAVALFPFSDIKHAKKRPLVVLAPSSTLGAHPPQHLCAMITSTKALWSSDIPIQDYKSAGLALKCSIRLKLFTLDERLLVRPLGTLSRRDASALRNALVGLFAT
jgi:mRNA interferase MazF